MENVRLNIEGLEENETQDRVINQLEEIIGVREVHLSDRLDFVDVNYDEHTSVTEIHNHLQNNGYKVKDIDEKGC